jgi:hypothetical protein
MTTCGACLRTAPENKALKLMRSALARRPRPSQLSAVFGRPSMIDLARVQRFFAIVVFGTGAVACDPVCDIVRIRPVASDGRHGVPCVFDLQDAEAMALPYLGGPRGATGEVFLLRTYSPSGVYRVALKCEGYRPAFSQTFGWKLGGMGCGALQDVGPVPVMLEADEPRPPHE